MQLTDLAAAFQRIEATTARRQITQILAELFRRGRREAGILPHLLQGRLGPPYAAPDLGVDERGLALAIAAASGSAVEEVWRQYKQAGDLGLVAEALLPARGQPLAVRQVYEQLHAVADAAGPGAHEQKLGLLRDLLRRLGGPEARYVVRIVQGRLRLGVGDAAILEALSLACAGDSSLVPGLERAYSLCSDLGLVADTLLSQGPDALAHIHPTPGRPVLSALCDRLPSPAEVIRKLGRVIAEPKYDGLRLQVHRDREQVWLFTRRLENVTHAFPDLARAVPRQVHATRAILDGEAIALDPRTGRFLPFQETARRRRKYAVEEMEARYPLRYYAFDLLFLDGQDLTPLPLTERYRRLRQVVREQAEGVIALVPQRVTDDPAELAAFVDEMVRRGLEGAVVKRPDGSYHAGTRGSNWVKLKRGYQVELADTFDLVILGYERGRGKRARLGIGSLLCGVYDPELDRFRTLARVGSGLSDAEWRELRERLDAIQVPTKPPRVDSELVPDVWVEPQYVVEVIAAEVTRSPRHTAGKRGSEPGYSLRFPRVYRLRPDRRAEDATTEAEVLSLYSRSR